MFQVFVKLKLMEQALVDEGGGGSSAVRYGTSLALEITTGVYSRIMELHLGSWCFPVCILVKTFAVLWP